MKKTLLSLLTFLSICFSVDTLKAQTVLATEDFTAGVLPSGWTNDSLGLTPMNVWLFDNPYARAITGASFDTHFAIFDSDEGSTNDDIDEFASLTTSDFSLSLVTGIAYLEYDEQYRALFGPNTDGSSRRVEYSIDGGSNWATLVYDSLDYGYPDPAAHSSFALNTGSATDVRFRFTWTGSWDWWWAIDNVSLVDYPVTCTTPPNAGTANSSLASVCAFNSFSLYLTGADSSTGNYWQWQESTDNINWNDIVGATSNTYLYSGQIQDSYYRCQISCSGQTAASTEVMVMENPALSCYCIPEYVTGCDALGKVSLNTLLSESGVCDGIFPENYTLFPDSGNYTTDLGTGDYYDLTIASGLGTGNHSAGVWFDFNADGDFQDAGEYFHISDSIPESSGDFIMNINVPNNAVLGATRMRVRYIYSDPCLSTSDCVSEGFGETEDYTVNVVIGTGIKHNPLQAIRVYPVPAHDRIFIQSPVQGAMDITLLDQTGRICRQLHSATNSMEIRTGDLAAGIYFVKFDTENYTITKKIVLN